MKYNPYSAIVKTFSLSRIPVAEHSLHINTPPTSLIEMPKINQLFDFLNNNHQFSKKLPKRLLVEVFCYAGKRIRL